MQISCIGSVVDGEKLTTNEDHGYSEGAMSSRVRGPLGTRVIQNGDNDGKNYSPVRQQRTADDDARQHVVNNGGYSGRNPGAVVPGRRFVPTPRGVQSSIRVDQHKGIEMQCNDAPNSNY